MHLSTDGHKSDLVIFAPEQVKPTDAVIFLHPALGTPAGYYLKLAEQLCQRNSWVVAIGELRGNASSSLRASRSVDWGYWEVSTYDMPANLAKLRSLYPDGPLYLMGHSIGGIMISLYLARVRAEGNMKAYDDIQGMLIIASGSLYHKTYPKSRIWYVAFLIMMLVYIFGYLPGKRIKLGNIEAKTLMLDWAHEIRTGRCEPKNCPHDDISGELKRFNKPVHFISFDKDNYVPHESTARLATFFPEETTTHLKVDPKEYDELKVLNTNALHFRWARGEVILPMIEDFFVPNIKKANAQLQATA